MQLTVNQANPLLGGLIAAEYLKTTKKIPLEVTWGDTASVSLDGAKTFKVQTSNDLLRIFARALGEAELYGSSALEKTETDHWLTLAIGPLTANGKDDFWAGLTRLDQALSTATYLVGKRLTIADFAVFAALYVSNKWNDMVAKKEAPTNALRWYNFLQAQTFVQNTFNSLPNDARAALKTFRARTNSRRSVEKTSRRSVEKTEKCTAGNRAREGKFVELPGAEMGKVVVRFPPEASGYLHIGHAKAALLNQYYQEAFQGKLVMRFDDTNPAKENVHFEEVILEDVAMLEVKPDVFTYTSDYFDLFLEYCERLLKDGKAYVDDTDPETMKSQREQKIESASRSNNYEVNLKLWEEMKKGTEKGQKCCVRAKIDMQSPNGCLRDPTIYRCKNEPHPRTGDKYKVYPTYDFACPIVDAIEGVTHTLRTMEYHDRDPQFYWFIDALGLRKPYIWEYSRLSMTNTVLSKRKLTWFVNEKLVDGWDDPRMPTVRGVLRRGMTVQGLKEFIVAQGSSRSVVFMEWDKIWAFNKKVIDPIAPRFTAVDKRDRVTVNVKGVQEEKLDVAKHPKNLDIGTKEVWIGPRVLIDRVDAEALKEGENATFINWGNLLISKIHRKNGVVTEVEAEPNLSNKDYKKTLKLTWLAETKQAPFTPAWCVYFDHIISKPLLGKDEDFKQYVNHDTRKEVEMLGDPELKSLKKGDIIQLQRRGFFRVDVAYGPRSPFTSKEQSVILFYIPDGHTKDNPAVTAVTNKPAADEPSATPAKTGKSAAELDAEITKQGDIVRTLKAQKAAKSEVESAVKTLLELKANFKNLAGAEWKPGSSVASASSTVSSSASAKSASDLDAEITKQGDIVRNVKAQKAPKPEVEAAVKVLLELKGKYKEATGKDWKPGSTVATATPASSSPVSAANVAEVLDAEITKQGDLVRNLKAQKAPKPEVEAAVKILLELKTKYKEATGKDWKPGTTVAAATPAIGSPVSSANMSEILDAEITKQGDIVRHVKAQKAPKPEVDAAVKILLELKTKFKEATGKDWKPGTTVAAATPASGSTVSSANTAEILDAEITKQGDIVRNVKAQKAPKPEVETAVKILLELKAKYKEATGKDWKPGTTVAAATPASGSTVSSANTAEILDAEITKQGDIVRNVKAQKAPKPEVDAAVKILLELKAKYKEATGKDWKPGTTVAAATPASCSTVSSANTAEIMDAEITKQGDIVRNVKAQKAPKSEVDAAVKILLELKAKYKEATGKDWKPGTTVATATPASGSTASPANIADVLDAEIVIRTDLAEHAVKNVLELKRKYREATGKDWNPRAAASTPASKHPKADLWSIAALQEVTVAESPMAGEEDALNTTGPTKGHLEDLVTTQGNLVRDLKEELDGAVKKLLELKAEYKKVAETERPSAAPAKPSSSSKQEKTSKDKAPKAKPAATGSKEKKPVAEQKQASADSGLKKQTRLGLEAKKEDDLSEWYSQVITKSKMIRYYDVSGCYVLMPWSYHIWDFIREWFSKEIGKLGVTNCYFPMFVSKAALEKEKAHIADFSPEVAWVTRSGDTEMAEPIAIRPTSETVMYPAFRDEINSHRDLPLKLNQWNNVVRWEFKHPQPFLRTREFLWQEGHTAYATYDEAAAEVVTILDLYAKVYTDLLAIPVVKGRKTDKEKFAGGDYTLTVEAFVSASGRAIQGATSHHLGQNFSKMFDIVFEDPDTQEQKYVYQNSWGITTRTVGVMVMVHADNKGLVLPPRVASVQAVIVPCGITASLSDKGKNDLQASCNALEADLEEAGVRVTGDYRSHYSPGWKFNHWELKGVPIRVELGPKDIEKNQIVAVRRDTNEKITLPREGSAQKLRQMLDDIHNNLLQKATDDLTTHTVNVSEWSQFSPALEKKNIILALFCGDSDCEDKIKADSASVEAEPGAPSMGAKSLCIPLDQPKPVKDSDRCIHPDCTRKPRAYVLFGRSY